MTKTFFIFFMLTLSFTGINFFGMPLGLATSIPFIAMFSLVIIVKHRNWQKMKINHTLIFILPFFILGGILSAFNAANIARHILEIFQTIWVLVAITIFMPSAIRLWPKTTLRALFFGATINFLIANYDYFFNKNLSSVLNNTTITASGINFPIELLERANFNQRYSGLADHVNTLGQFSVAIFTLSLGMLIHGLTQRKWKVSLFASIMIVISLAANIASGSFSGHLALVLATFILFFGLILPNISNTGAKFLTILAATSLLFFLFFYSESGNALSLNNRVLDAYNRVTNTTGPIRQQLTNEALSLISKNPIMGYGMDPLSQNQIFIKHSVHNIFLLAWVSGGIFSLLGMVLVYGFYSYFAIKTLLVFRDKAQGWLLISFSTMLIAQMAINMVQPISFTFISWFPIALLIGYWPSPVSESRDGQ
ncbi:MAG: O-antigen ligase family protein [Bacteroidetes bacterium]|nr:O-antigen ligase family protein [Bacteroidota bacterium]